MFGKPNAIVYVRRGGLIVAGKHIKPARLSFSDAWLSNLEVIDEAAMGEHCSTFFSEHGVKGQRLLVVLDHSVVFTKTVAIDKTVKVADVLKEFVAQMPFEPGVRACLALQSAEALSLFATNARIYSVLAAALNQAGVAKVIAITPLAAYGVNESAQLSGAVVDQLLRDTTIKTKADFQSVEPE